MFVDGPRAGAGVGRTKWVGVRRRERDVERGEGKRGAKGWIWGLIGELGRDRGGREEEERTGKHRESQRGQAMGQRRKGREREEELSREEGGE